MRLRIGLLLLLTAFLSVDCAHQHRYDRDDEYGHPSQGPGRGYGPPPHAPAHGYRHKYQDRDFQYDAHIGVYIVLGLPDIYWLDDWYHRRVGDRWQHAERWDGPWYDSNWDQIPPGLRGGGKPGKGKDKEKKKGPGPY